MQRCTTCSSGKKKHAKLTIILEEFTPLISREHGPLSLFPQTDSFEGNYFFFKLQNKVIAHIYLYKYILPAYYFIFELFSSYFLRAFTCCQSMCNCWHKVIFDFIMYKFEFAAKSFGCFIGACVEFY